jgi:Ala-tRNA(Pro) deacylase
MATRRIIEFLNGNNIKYVMTTHSPAYTAQEVAAAAHVPGRQFAKAVIVRIDGELAMAVVPATCKVDTFALRSALGAEFVEVVDKPVIAERFEGCQLGAMPPLGNLFGMQTYVDREIAKSDDIAFNAGTHSDVVWMRFDDYRRLVHPKLLHIAIPMTEEDERAIYEVATE